jgi:hypothetical protein
MDGLLVELQEAKAAIKVRNSLIDALDKIIEVNAAIREIVDGGSFASIPISIKSAMNEAWVATKALETKLTTDAEITEVLDWSPPS